MSSSLSILSLPIIYYISRLLSKKYSSERYYISNPYIGSLLAVMIFSFLEQPFEVPQSIERIFLCVFLFSIGYQTVPFLKKKFFYRSMGLILLTILLITSMELFSKLLDEPYQSLFGSVFFAYNKDLLRTTVDSTMVSFIEFWGSFQMVLIFLTTPLFLLAAERMIKPSTRPHLSIAASLFPIKRTATMVLSLWFVTLCLVWLSNLSEDHIPFLYDFVFAMAGGGLLRGYELKWGRENKKRAHLLPEVGTLHLYLFIIVTITEQFQHLLKYYDVYFKETIFFFLLMKMVIIGLLAMYVVKRSQPGWENPEWMVGAVAGWTFSLNAPVVCMHGMRTAVNKWGPAPYILFIVPPIILWVVNYIHLLLLAILQR